ncbi:MAG: ribonuclease E/G, partial [candidate division WOR-3 bacterium]
MKKQIFLNIRRDDVRVAVRENGELVEFYIERGDSSFSPGTIIKGKLIAIRKELNAVFVDIGAQSAGFLPLNDFYLSLPHRKNDEEGLEFLVQVKKEPYGSKGARLTTFIAIPGRYLVLMPFKEAFGVSRKIRKEKDRQKLKKIAKELYSNDGKGIIVRT